MTTSFEPLALPAWLDRGLRASGAVLAGVALVGAWWTAGPGNWAASALHGSGPGVQASVPAADAPLRCAVNAVGAGAIPAQN